MVSARAKPPTTGKETAIGTVDDNRGKRKIELLNARVLTCRKCSRLVDHRQEMGRVKRRAYRDQQYWAKPVPGFGELDAGIVIIGLAPGAHGSNRTGRMFTGDASGDFLYPALYRAGLASQPESTDLCDGMSLHGCYITAAVRCAPPGNRPTAEEKANCRPYLVEELELLERARVLLCLGQIAFEGCERALGARLGRFAHGASYTSGDLSVLCSYHVSRQNTQTGRLTVEMFEAVLVAAKRLAGM